MAQNKSSANKKKNFSKTKKDSIPVSKPTINNFTKNKELLERVDAFFEKKLNIFFLISIIIFCVIGALLFDLKITEGTDDSGYILAAHNFILGKVFPTFHGTFYAIFLSLPMLIFGVNLTVFKIISFILMLAGFIFLYATLKNRMSSTILLFVLILTAMNSHFLYYASTTYSEPLYFLLQSLTFYFLFQLIDVTDQSTSFQSYKYWHLWLSFGFSIFLLALTRNIGMGVLFTLTIFFLFQKKIWEILYTYISFLIFQVPFGIYKNLFWKQTNIGFESQFNELLYVDPYTPSKGFETFHGFLIRFYDNSQLYLSKHFFQILGFLDIHSSSKSLMLTVIVYLFFFIAFIFAFRKKNKVMQLLSLYLAISIGATFVMLQTFWDQERMIILYFPLILILIGYGIYELSMINKLKFFQPTLILFFVITFFTSFKQTTDQIEVNEPILTENLNGNLFYGFTPDWVNYFQMSEWISKNINKDSVVACRKPSMAFIYSKGHPFYGIYSLPQLDADTVINNMIKRNADVVIIDQMDLLKKIPPNISMQIRPYISRVLFGNDKAYLICELPQPIKTELTGAFANLKITAMYDLKAFFQNVKASKKDYFAEDPDYLLNILRKNHVSYAILASIRRFSSQKTGDIIDTVHRFLYLIELKYPSVFKKIYQIGNENNEPATLISISYPKTK